VYDSTIYDYTTVLVDHQQKNEAAGIADTAKNNRHYPIPADKIPTVPYVKY
jgi:hypothetical protein